MKKDITKKEFKGIYNMLEFFVFGVNKKDFDALEKHFNMTKEVFSELNEELDCFYEERPTFGLPTIDQALLEINNRKETFDFDDGCKGIDFNILSNGKIDEPMFHFRVCQEGKLEYLYVGS